MDVILDVDPGVDDALAILLALGSPQLNVLALTVVSGNVPVEIGVENALRVLSFAGRDDIDVYAGASGPLTGAAVHATEVHGVSGMGNAELPPSIKRARPGATTYIQTVLQERPGEVTLVAVGPLTNLALVEEDKPGTLNLAKEIVVMGGAVAEPGNVTAVAEFNFYADPLAARQVLDSSESLAVVPLDVTHQVGMGKGEISDLARKSGTPLTDFLEKATEVVVSLGEQAGGYAGVYLHDPTAVAYASCPHLFQSDKMWISVETDGHLTAGQLVADLRSGVFPDQRQGKLRTVVTAIASEKVLNLFKKRALGLGA